MSILCLCLLPSSTPSVLCNLGMYKPPGSVPHQLKKFASRTPSLCMRRNVHILFVEELFLPSSKTAEITCQGLELRAHPLLLNFDFLRRAFSRGYERGDFFQSGVSGKVIRHIGRDFACQREQLRAVYGLYACEAELWMLGWIRWWCIAC